MAKYRITSYHEICEDSYEEGKGKSVSRYDYAATISANTPKEVVEKYLNKYLLVDTSERAEYDEDIAYISKLVDADGCAPSKAEIEWWKKGEVKLYSENITMRVYLMDQVEF